MSKPPCSVCGKESKWKGLCRKCYYDDYNEKNKDRIREVNKRYKQRHKDGLKKLSKKYYEENKEKILAKNKEWMVKNKERIRQRRCDAWKNNKEYMLREKFRNKIRDRIVNWSGNRKAFRTAKLLGCSIKKAQEYLESQFVDGMSWDNYGEWHIDHIMPVSSFDLSNPEEQKKCFHYTNLQPLWAYDNLSKGNKIENG